MDILSKRELWGFGMEKGEEGWGDEMKIWTGVRTPSPACVLSRRQIYLRSSSCDDGSITRFDRLKG